MKTSKQWVDERFKNGWQGQSNDKQPMEDWVRQIQADALFSAFVLCVDFGGTKRELLDLLDSERKALLHRNCLTGPRTETKTPP